MAHITPIVHLTNDCNLGCKYCYTGSAFLSLSKRQRINDEFSKAMPVLHKMTDEVMAHNEFVPTTFIYHGGEPLLIDIPNWERLLSYGKSKGYSIRNAIQTNATLIDEAYIQLFKENNFSVGVSLDGNEAMNDQSRPLKSGKSSFGQVMRGIELMKANGIQFGVLVTLNRMNMDHIDEIYDFFKQGDISFSIRPIFQTIHSDDKTFQITAEEYGEVFCRLFDIWFEDEEVNPGLINEFTSIVAQFVEPIEGLVSCNFTRKCSEHFISMDIKGEVTPCNRFYGAKEFVYGNLETDGLEKLLSGNTARPLAARWERLAKTECYTCDVKQFCYGGCPANSFSIKGDYFAKDYYCSAYKRIFRHVNGRVAEKLAAQEQSTQPTSVA